VSKETRQLYDLVTDLRGGVPVLPVHPEFITSTDDSTLYIFEGHSSEPDVFRLVTKDAIATKGTKSVYNIDDSNAMSGMRVRNTWTFSLAGLCAPLYLTVSSLNDREMPPGRDMVVLKIPGLCIGGSGIGANTLDGFVVFTRKGNGNDKKRFQYYQKNVLIPYINWLRKEFAGYNIEDGTTIPDELTAVAWCDGDASQLNSMTNEYKLLRDQKIIANKQNAARTAVEQAADLMPVFKFFNKDAKKHTVTNVDASRHPMKMKVMSAWFISPLYHFVPRTP
jgi:hypothetical protein